MIPNRLYGFLFLMFYAVSAGAQIEFSEEATVSGITNEGFNYGIAFGDYDNDGDDDVYISRYNDSNILYENIGSGYFRDVTFEAGVRYDGKTFMSVWGDMDNDGDLDLFVANSNGEDNIYFENQGDGTFDNKTLEAGLTNLEKSRTVLLGDLDNDGWLDIYLANNGAQNSFMHNNGDGTFSDITVESGATDLLIAMGAVLFDYDNDNDLDIYLTHDDYEAYILYRNDGNNRFTDVSEEAGVNYEGLGMGVDAGDFNNDGFQDLYISNMLENVLYLNKGDGTFEDITLAARVEDDGMGWGVSWLDYDNDGWEDIYLVNDSDFFPNPNILYRNLGNNTFSKASEGTILKSEYEGYGMGCADLNMDGRLDLLIANRDRPNELFLNHCEGGNWVKFKAIGTTSNRSAIGTRIELIVDGSLYVDQITGGSGYSSQNSLTLHFGLAQAQSIERVKILWPSGIIDIYEGVEANQYYVVKEDAGITSFEQEFFSCDFDEKLVVNEVHDPGKNFGISFADFDNDGDDDYYISRQGDNQNLFYRNIEGENFVEISENAGLDLVAETVTSIWGDINNDGLEDLYVGTKGKDYLFLNKGDFTFEDISESAGITHDRRANSVNMADVNNDGFLDIYVANIAKENILYRNDGDLTFTDITASSGATDRKIAMGAIFFDYDEDGDQDLYLTHDGKQEFIMYQNNGNGKFTDVSVETGLNYAGYGMGVDVGDYNNDGHLDVYVTDFYENILFSNNGDGTFTNTSAEAGVEDLGMGWGTVFFDYDNDGWQDIYVANNSYFSPYPNVLYRNRGDGTFETICPDSQVLSMAGANGMATTDINNDGLEDLFVANDGVDGNELFFNQNSGNNWIKFKPVGTASNRSGVGTRVEIWIDGLYTADEVNAGASYASQNSSKLHFGLGNQRQVDRVRFKWPSGLVETYENIPANKIYYVIEDEGIQDTPYEKVVTSVQEEYLQNLVNVYPNPFDDNGIIYFDLNLERAGPVTLELFDLMGRKIATPFDGRLAAGNSQISWQSGSHSANVMVYQISYGEKVIHGKLIRE